jgi:two-component system OmpR family response regulator
MVAPAEIGAVAAPFRLRSGAVWDRAAMRVLLVEAERRMAELLRRRLLAQGLAVDVVHTGEDALALAGATVYAAIALEARLPGLDGVATCRRLRADGHATPILLLTGRDAVDDRIAGVEAGVDDHLVKPFAFRELVARLGALGERGGIRAPAALRVGDLELDPVARVVRRGAATVHLSAREYAVLYALMTHPGDVLDRLELIELAWDGVAVHGSNVVDVYINYLRRKIDRPFGRRSIETIRGVGYRIRVDGGLAPATAYA